MRPRLTGCCSLLALRASSVASWFGRATPPQPRDSRPSPVDLREPAAPAVLQWFRPAAGLGCKQTWEPSAARSRGFTKCSSPAAGSSGTNVGAVRHDAPWGPIEPLQQPRATCADYQRPRAYKHAENNCAVDHGRPVQASCHRRREPRVAFVQHSQPKALSTDELIWIFEYPRSPIQTVWFSRGSVRVGLDGVSLRRRGVCREVGASADRSRGGARGRRWRNP